MSLSIRVQPGQDNKTSIKRIEVGLRQRMKEEKEGREKMFAGGNVGQTPQPTQVSGARPLKWLSLLLGWMLSEA